jgi:peptide/nickel transport system ATP-binding protein/oligopeptide transport system ATP-binding protein
VTVRTKNGPLPVVRDLSFSLAAEETLGVVGESGSGKSMTALAIMRLLAEPACRITGGRILFRDKDLGSLPAGDMRRIRGKSIAMIFQEPMTSLNPVLTIGYQLNEAIRCHEKAGSRDIQNRSLHLLQKVGIPLPEQRMKEYPYQLSGGMRQRVMIAMALACRPQILICDEPTTALDVTIQSQILQLIAALKAETKTAVLLITHDMGVLSEMADHILVMYAGMVMEYARAEDLFRAPLHPYTIGLMASIPKLNEDQDALAEIPGTVPSPESLPGGCLFHDRCFLARPVCKARTPDMQAITGRMVRCWQYSSAWEAP